MPVLGTDGGPCIATFSAEGQIDRRIHDTLEGSDEQDNIAWRKGHKEALYEKNYQNS
jgi:hypothetical protein